MKILFPLACVSVCPPCATVASSEFLRPGVSMNTRAVRPRLRRRALQAHRSCTIIVSYGLRSELHRRASGCHDAYTHDDLWF